MMLPRIDKRKLDAQFQAIHETLSPKKVDVLPVSPQEIAVVDHPCQELQGKKIGCLCLAGGQATRLGLNTPKGCLPISPISNKSLFQILAEKIIAYGECYHETPRLGVMTSDATDLQIREHFEKNHFFGLQKERVDFFVQPSLPLISLEGRPVFDENKNLLLGPDGNGSLFSSFVSSFTCDAWEEEKIEVVSICLIDNPLIDPFYPAMLLPILSGADLSAAAIQRIDPNEKVGVFARKDDHLCVVEYSELADAGRETTQDGSLLFPWANISFFATSLSYIRKVAFLPLPLHVAKKQVQNKWVWKSEYFIFDYLPFAKEVVLLAIDRKKYFSPIKALQDIAIAQQAILVKDQERHFELTGERVTTPLELPQSAYYRSF